MGKMKKSNNKSDGGDNNKGWYINKFNANCFFFFFCDNKGYQKKCRKWKAYIKKKFIICVKKGHLSRYCKFNQNNDHGGAWENGTRCGSKADNK